MEEKKYEVYGYKKIDYVRKDSTQVQAYELYLSKCVPDPGIQGDQFLVVFLNCKYSQYVPNIGDFVVPMYNRYGKIEDVYLV